MTAHEKWGVWWELRCPFDMTLGAPTSAIAHEEQAIAARAK